MKRIFYILILLSSFKHIFGQINLVPNPSFEDTLQCPPTLNIPITAADWSSFGGTSDYFNSCSNSNSCGVSVPYNFAGYQLAATGHAYCGIICYTEPSVGTDIREYIGAQLTSPLITGTKYYVSFKTCLAKGACFPFNIASNKIGIRFSKYVFPYFSAPPVFNSAHIYSNTVITDSINWTTIKSSFVADSNYTHIICGNFFDDINTDTINFETPNISSYYYIDDICVSTDSLTTITAVNEFPFSDYFEIYPNPTSDFITIKVSNQIKSPKLNLLNSIGQNIIVKSIYNLEKIDLTNLSEGIYFIKITSDIRTDYEKIIVRH